MFHGFASAVTSATTSSYIGISSACAEEDFHLGALRKGTCACVFAILYTFSCDIFSCVKALWNHTLLQRVGYSLSSDRPLQEPALLDCKETYFTLCGRKPIWGALLPHNMKRQAVV